MLRRANYFVAVSACCTLGACSLPSLNLFGGASEGESGNGTDGGSGLSESLTSSATFWLVTIPLVAVVVSFALPSTRPAVVAFITAIFRIASAIANLVALPFEVLVSYLRQLVRDKWKPERWSHDDLGGTPQDVLKKRKQKDDA